MLKIGIVLSGGMSKVSYEIGCLHAIFDRFRTEDIRCISAASIGVLPAYAFSCGKETQLENLWKEIGETEYSRSMLKISQNPNVIDKFKSLIASDDRFTQETFFTVWNFTKQSAEYIPLKNLTVRERTDYLLASVTLPIINKGVRIKNNVYFDGAFLDNIPVYPLLTQDLDFIFCIYFDGWNYQFENQEFDKKIIKLHHFPKKSGLDFIIYDSSKIDQMIDFSYTYTSNIIDKIFFSDNRSDIYSRINIQNTQQKNRITSEILLTNLNRAMLRLSKRNIL